MFNLDGSCFYSIVLVSAVSLSLAAGCGADSGSNGDPVHGSDHSAEEYTLPDTPVIKPGSLTAFDVTGVGSFRQVPVAELQQKNWDWGDQGEYYPSASTTGVEVYDLLSPGYVLMGLGTRVDNSAVTRMRTRQIGIRNDWSWDPVGATWRDVVRHFRDDGQNGMELEVTTLKPRVVTGVGMGIRNQNTVYLMVQEREYSPLQRKLIGAKYRNERGCCFPGERYWDTSYVTQTIEQQDKMVVVGVGLREDNDNLATLRVYAAYLD